jgi:esterase/lipase superfamily enzyme
MKAPKMANPDQLKTLRQGVDAWNAWRKPSITPDLREADLGGANLSGANLHEADLSGGNLSRANLREADLSGGNLRRANLREADLSGANLHEADLSGGNLSRANLHEADLSGGNLSRANLREADLSGANLSFATLVDVDITNADLTGCHIYGASAWGLMLSDKTKQRDLIITLADEPAIAVDNIEVAQFIYLLLHSQKLRGVIDTITSKVVLILGRFTDERKAILDVLRDELRKRDYLPIVFNFDKPINKTTHETITLLGRTAEFVIADISDANVFVPELPSVPVLPLIKASPEGVRFDIRSQHPVIRYETLGQLRQRLKFGNWVEPLQAKALDLRTTTVSTSAGDATEAEYTVWYGTNRAPKKPGDETKGYSSSRDTTVHYGSCRVFIPKSHKIGSIGSPWWKRMLTGKDDRLRLRGIQPLDTTVYWRALSVHLASVNRDQNFAVVFVHGYNVSFEEAALRAAQIGFDLSIQSAMAFFSWPSRGTLKGYLADAAAIEASETAITDYLVDFGNLSGAQTVHIIAHSMGNRAVLRALHRIAERARRRSKAKFGQIILAAADVDTDVFRQHSSAVARVGQRATLYVSTRDRAIEASRWLWDFPRAGLMPPVVVEKGIDTINVTNIDLTQLGHGYIADARDVLRDIHELIARGTPPQQRFGLRNARTEDGRDYWVIGA